MDKNVVDFAQPSPTTQTPEPGPNQPPITQPLQNTVTNPAAVNTLQIPLQPEKHASSWAVIGLLITFPPAAWIMMWKDKKFHSWYHKILLLYGILGLLGVIDTYFSIPDINKTYHTLGLSSPANLMAINELNALFSVLQIAYALFLWLKLKNRDISVIDVILSGILIFIPFLIILYLTMVTFLTPIYNISPQMTQYSPQTVNGLTLP